MGDSRSFETYLKISRIIGLCPWKRITNNIFDVLSRVNLLVCSTVFIFTSILTIVNKVHVIKESKHEYKFPLVVVDILEGVCGFIFMASLLTKCLFFSTDWNSLLASIQNPSSIDFATRKKKYAAFFKVIVSHAVTSCIFIFETYSWFGVADHEKSVIEILSAYVSLGVRFYYQFVLVCLIWELSAILEHRYNLIKVNILNIFSRDSGRVVFPKHLKQRIRVIKSDYADLYKAVSHASGFFGITILMFLACTVAALLNSCCWGLYYGYAAKVESDWIGPLLTSVLVSPLHNLALTTFLVMACDRVERSGENLINACFLLLQEMDKSDISDELTFLVQQLQALAPKFSAVGLFYVNRRVLSTLMTFTTAYVIVILQFKN
ncbi:uncharacterized protein [Leptinotarsa decemlineata]|uniref:uncharacterized protein n=1 Tax=Leptinotarsa decemlineata TaxID=7539 RepID=UPI003D30C3E8